MSEKPAMTPCKALLLSIPRDIADRQWVKEAAKILRKHEPMEAELVKLRADYAEATAELDRVTI